MAATLSCIPNRGAISIGLCNQGGVVVALGHNRNWVSSRVIVAESVEILDPITADAVTRDLADQVETQLLAYYAG